MDNSEDNSTLSRQDIVKKINSCRKDLDYWEEFLRKFDELSGTKTDTGNKTPMKVDKTDTPIEQRKNLYPRSGTKEEKVLSAFIGQALLMNDIERYIIEENNDHTIKSLSYVVHKMIDDGLIATRKIGDSNFHKFYAPVQYLNEKKRLKDEHMPLQKSWGNFDEDRMQELIKKSWTAYKMKT